VIARKEQLLGQFRADLVYFDATLRLFAPKLEPKTIPAVSIHLGMGARHPRRNLFMKKLTRDRVVPVVLVQTAK
jgi:hypothetical protein